MVENVEETRTDLELSALGDRESLIDVQVRVKVAETAEAVTPRSPIGSVRFSELALLDAAVWIGKSPGAADRTIGAYAANGIGWDERHSKNRVVGLEEHV